MRVYVAAKFEDAVEARAVMNGLEQEGHEITHDWTHEDEAGRTGMELDHYLGGCAQGDLEGVRAAEAIIVLHHDRLCGGLVELGAALADPDKIVAVVGGMDAAVQPIFYRLPAVNHFNAARQAIAYLGLVERLRSAV